MATTTTTTCFWKCGDNTPDHEHFTVIVREGGKLLGRLTPRGTCNKLKVHAAVMGRERADKIAAEINAAGEFTAKVAVF